MVAAPVATTCTGGHDLHGAAECNGLPQPADAVEGELQPDPEQEEDDADLGQQLDLMGITDDS